MDLGDVCLNRNAMQEFHLKFCMAGGIPMQTQVSQRHYPGCPRAAFRYARTAAYAERSRFPFWKPQAADARIIHMIIKNICPILGQGGRKLGTIQKKGHIKSGCHNDESQ